MKEANTFIDINTTFVHVFTIFSEAARKLNLLLGDDELGRYLKQASAFYMLQLVKQTFAYIFVSFSPSNPRAKGAWGVLCTRNPNEPANKARLLAGDPLHGTDCLGLPVPNLSLSYCFAEFRATVSQLVQ
jgi:hypothetical protein